MRGMALLLLAIAWVRVASLTMIAPPGPVHVVLNARFLPAAITVACLGIGLWMARGHLVSTPSSACIAVLAVAMNVLPSWC